MPDLMPICALGGAMPDSRQYGALTLAENPDLGLASLALRRGAVAPDLGLALPGPGEWVQGDGIAAFWTGPDQWMVEYPGRAADDVASVLSAAAPGCSVTEQTDGFAAFEIRSSAGPAPIEALLERLVNLDTARLAPGAATRTGLHHMSVFVIRRAPDHLALLGMRSAAASIWHALTATAQRQEEQP